MTFLFAAALLLSAGPSTNPTKTAEDGDVIVRGAMESELGRAHNELRLPGAAPHHITYTVTDSEAATAEATFGALTVSEQGRQRYVRVGVRVGDAQLDSGNFAAHAGGPEGASSGTASAMVSFEDDAFALRKKLWRQTDEAYKSAVGLLGKKRMARKSEAGAADRDQPWLDWAPAKVGSSSFVMSGATEALDLGKLSQLTRALSAQLRGVSGLHSSNVSAVHYRVRKRVATSDGGWKDERLAFVNIAVKASAQAEDGMQLDDLVTFNATSLAGLPTLAVMERRARDMATALAAARNAPTVEPATSVVLFEDRAAAQLARRLLAESLSGTPPPATPADASGNVVRKEAGNLAQRLGQNIGPRFLQVWDDPAGGGKAAGTFFGSYRADDEAVAAQRVKVITDGTLTGLLTSRTPSRRLPLSNGHGRGTATAGAVRGQVGVLVVSAGAAAVAEQKLAARALVSAKALGKGTPVYVVRTLTSGAELSTLRPLEVYRLLANGERQRVRGLVLRNLTAGSLRDIVAMGRRPYVYNYVTPRSSFEGSAPPTTVIAPAMILDRVEVQRDPRKAQRPALYPSPLVEVR